MGDTEEWKEAAQKAHDMREDLRAQFELKNSYGELRNRLEEWGEDKQWKAREESNRRSNAGRDLPTIPEGGGNDGFGNTNPHDSEDFETKLRQMQRMI